MDRSAAPALAGSGPGAVADPSSDPTQVAHLGLASLLIALFLGYGVVAALS